MRWTAVALIVALLVAAFCVYLALPARWRSGGCLPSFVERTATVHRIIDGDTIELDGGERVRLVGINAPELHPEPEPGALEAMEFLENICPPGTTIGLNIDDMKTHDVYGRTLAVIYVKISENWVNVNAELLRRGLAEILFIPPSEFNPWEWLENS
jgi:micrococcal nuclease